MVMIESAKVVSKTFSILSFFTLIPSVSVCPKTGKLKTKNKANAVKLNLILFIIYFFKS